MFLHYGLQMSENYYYKCHQCQKMFPIEELKYHTTPEEEPVLVFCGAECSFNYFQPKYNDNGIQ